MTRIDRALDSGLRDLPDQLGHVVLLGIAVLGPDEGHAVVPVAEVVDLEAVLRPDPGNRHRLQREDDRVLGERMQVVDAGPHRERRGLLAAVQEHPGPGTRATGGSLRAQLLDEVRERPLDPEALGRDQLAAAEPGRHHDEEEHADQRGAPRHRGRTWSGSPRRMRNLDGQEERGSRRAASQQRPLPAVADDDEEEDRRDRDRAGDRHPVGEAELGRGLEDRARATARRPSGAS